MDDRKLTVIVVPHGQLETRSYEIPYRRLRLALILFAGVVLIAGVVLATWFPVAAQAARVPSLERQLDALHEKQAEVVRLAEALEEVEAQYERVRALLGADAPTNGMAPTLPPLRRDTAGAAPAGEEAGTAQGVLHQWPLAVRGFITRSVTTSRAAHPGIDIAVPENSNIRSAGAGVVRHAGEDAVYGRYVILDHGNGLESLYGHASRILVAPGERIAANELIGLSGSTGRTTGPHLHFEVRRHGEVVDPLMFVRQP